MVRGIEGRPIFVDDADREDLLRRVQTLVESGALAVYAWALMPNHVHLLLRTASLPLSRSMRSLLTGYACWFNRRHTRCGHLFQNRFKSIVCEEDAYLLELIRYIHLNPLRGGIVGSLEALDSYPFTGHSTLVGIDRRGWQCRAEILERFSGEPRNAVARYRAFVALGVSLGRRRELGGGGLVRSVGGWKAVLELRKGREIFAADERVLGGSQFVAGLLQVARCAPSTDDGLDQSITLEELTRRVSEAVDIPGDALIGSSRLTAVCRAREGLAYLWIECLARSGHELALVLGIRPGSAYRAAKRGRAFGPQWRTLVGRRGQ